METFDRRSKLATAVTSSILSLAVIGCGNKETATSSNSENAADGQQEQTQSEHEAWLRGYKTGHRDGELKVLGERALEATHEMMEAADNMVQETIKLER